MVCSKYTAETNDGCCDLATFKVTMNSTARLVPCWIFTPQCCSPWLEWTACKMRVSMAMNGELLRETKLMGLDG